MSSLSRSAPQSKGESVCPSQMVGNFRIDSRAARPLQWSLCSGNHWKRPFATPWPPGESGPDAGGRPREARRAAQTSERHVKRGVDSVAEALKVARVAKVAKAAR